MDEIIESLEDWAAGFGTGDVILYASEVTELRLLLIDAAAILKAVREETR